MPGAGAYPVMDYMKRDGTITPVLLVGKERDGRYRGLYNLFAGGWEEKKDGYYNGKPDLFETMKRELGEECGIRSVMRAVGIKRKPNVHVRWTPIWVFKVPQIRRRDFIPNEEMESMEFVPLEELLFGSIVKNIDGKEIEVSSFVKSTTNLLYRKSII